MALMEAVREFIKKCPYLEDFNREIGVDYLGEGMTTYVLENTPVDPIVQGYTDGSSERRFAFVFASREPYGEDTIINLENIEFYEHMAAWMEACTLKGELPELGGGRQALSMKAMTTPYLYTADLDKARYQIQCELIYYQPRDFYKECKQ